MTARRCFTGKVGAGNVGARAGEQILTMLDELEADYRKTLGDEGAGRQAALDVAAIARAEAGRKADLLNRTIQAQGATLKRIKSYDEIVNGLRSQGKAPLALRKGGRSSVLPALRAMLARDIHDIHGAFSNVHDLAVQLRGEAHARMAEAIRFLRPRFAGTTVSKARELEFLRAAWGDTTVSGDARAAYAGFNDASNWAGGQYRDAGGALTPRKDWRVPNPEFDDAKVRALGGARFRDLVLANVDRAGMIDWATAKPLSDSGLERVIEEAYRGFERGHFDAPPSGGVKGRRMLANSRDVPRVFVWRSPEAWTAIAEAMGVHTSPWLAAMEHVASLTKDTALMRVLGPNPQAWLRFANDVMAREPARLAVTGAEAGSDVAAVRANRKLEDKARSQAVRLEDVFDEVTGRNRIPVSTAIAAGMGDLRSALVASQMGSAIISSISDLATLHMTARFNRLPLIDVIRGVRLVAGRDGEILAAQQGLIADSLAHAAREDDRIMGQMIRTSVAAKMGTAVIRASGLRLWTAKLRAGFALGWMAHIARHPDVQFGALEPAMRDAFNRYGIGAGEWDLIRATQPFEPRPNALLVRPRDVAAGDTVAHRAAAEKLGRLINTEMEFAVIEQDPIARAYSIGSTRPGTVKGEALRAVTMYRFFSGSFVALHMTRAFSRGFDGSRLGHAGLTMIYMAAMGLLALQAKQIVAGRDPRSLEDPGTFGAALLQGGGLGVFGDLFGGAVTRDGNTLGPLLGGPIVSVGEDLKNFIVPNVRKLVRGEETHFAGDALYLASRYAPGHNLWYARLALQRVVLDQLALMIDPRARDRFNRMERDAARNYGQAFFWRPGETAPGRAPDLSMGLGR